MIRKTLQYSAITGIFGHRQVGKTTFSQEIAGQYVTFDVASILDEALIDPSGFLHKHSSRSRPLVIDECQMAPPLFPALKEWVRTRPQPGQFLLTGSVRFSSRKAIQESLTGRLIAWELLPMDLSEAHEAKLPDSLIRLAKAKTVEVELGTPSYFSHRAYLDYLEKGGLPGVFSVRDLAIREQKFESQLRTILERDLRLLIPTTLPYSSLRHFLAALAQQQTQPLDLAWLSRQSRISIPTISRLLTAFDAMYLIRLIRTEGSQAKPVIFLEDQGEASYLINGNYDDLTNLLRFCFAHFRVQFKYRSAIKSDFFQYRNRGGAYVPLAVHATSDHQRTTLGFVPILGSTPEKQALGSAQSFLKKYPSSKILFITDDGADRILSDKMRVIPLAKLV